MSYQYPPPPYQQPQNWSHQEAPHYPPGPPPRGSGVGRNIFGMFIALVVTPIGSGLIARGAGDSARWEALRSADRLAPNLQIIGGAIILLLIAALAAYAPLGPITAGLVWGLVPGGLALFFPTDAVRYIRDLPVISRETQMALSTWAIEGGVFVTGAVLVGAGLAAAMRGRR